jgi:hypothetical protein
VRRSTKQRALKRELFRLVYTCSKKVPFSTGIVKTLTKDSENDLLKLETYNTTQIDYLFNHTLLTWESDTDKINILT